jgi:hypothetical protein
MWFAYIHCWATDLFFISPFRSYVSGTEPNQIRESRVEAGSNTSTVALRVVGGDEKRAQCLGYNPATLFLEVVNTGTWPSSLGSLESETVKCGHESRETRTCEWLRWQGPAAIVNDRPIFSSERMLHKDYNRKCSVGKWSYWSQGACRQDELIGGKPSFLKQLWLKSEKRERERTRMRMGRVLVSQGRSVWLKINCGLL